MPAFEIVNYSVINRSLKPVVRQYPFSFKETWKDISQDVAQTNISPSH